ncbi:hypothetical protein K435DRAFT_867890 [Dendrothele bispora CBS 962.96]|uniref:Uncharacterized protein n=1 Tax=Dendrothele bispora (strain CBS 962.96) TaxID=1314807 RepID=A0A4S8LD70_DENBC|nr:hypothetical protein K435DRAFT_867890 [Dendrothele bispora CBS 962.96]
MPLSIDAYSMIYDASERVRKTIAPHWSAMAKYKISWTECQSFLSTIENDLQTLSLAAASSDTPFLRSSGLGAGPPPHKRLQDGNKSDSRSIVKSPTKTSIARSQNPSYKKTTARPSNLQGEPSVVIYRKPTQQPVIETPREPSPRPLEVSTPEPVEDKSGEDAAAPDDPLALRRTPRAAAQKSKEALDIQVNNSRKRPPSDEESLAVATKRQRQSKDTSSSSKASSSKDAGPSKKTSTTKTATSGIFQEDH